MFMSLESDSGLFLVLYYCNILWQMFKASYFTFTQQEITLRSSNNERSLKARRHLYDIPYDYI